MTSILIVQDRIPDYRVAFFNRLRDDLARHDVALTLAYSRPAQVVQAKNDAVALDWAVEVPVRRMTVAGREMTYQVLGPLASAADGIVLEYATRHLTGLRLAVQSRLGATPIAWWGHGANLQSKNTAMDRCSELVKRVLARSGSWFFAYTQGSADRFARAGVQRTWITVVQNSVDTSWADDLPPAEGSTVCVYLGALYADKRLDHLVEVADLLAARMPGFRLRIVGDGTLRPWLEQCATTRPHLEVTGRLQGPAKRAALADAALLLNPGLVGLVAVDSLASGRPIVTTAGALHSPEFEYLQHGVNAVVVQSDGPGEYADAVYGLLTNPERLSELAQNGQAAAAELTVEKMVANFVTGLLRWLQI